MSQFLVLVESYQAFWWEGCEQSLFWDGSSGIEGLEECDKVVRRGEGGVVYKESLSVVKNLELIHEREDECESKVCEKNVSLQCAAPGRLHRRGFKKVSLHGAQENPAQLNFVVLRVFPEEE